MHDAVGFEKRGIALQESRGGESLGHLLHLRVGEGNPYLVHFAGSKEAIDNLYIGTQERHIGHTLPQRVCSSRPHTGTLDIYSYKVLVGTHAP